MIIKSSDKINQLIDWAREKEEILKDRNEGFVREMPDEESVKKDYATAMKALTELCDACLDADENGDLDYRIDGRLLDNARMAIKVYADNARLGLMSEEPDEWPEDGSRYFAFDKDGDVDYFYWHSNISSCQWQKANGWVFRTEAEAQARYKEIMGGAE